MNSSVGVFTTDRDLVVRVWDNALARLTGIAAESALGRHVTTVIPDLEVRGLMKYFRRTLSDGVAEVLAPAFHKYLIRCAPLQPSQRCEDMRQRVIIAALESEGAVSGLIVTIEDVTARYDREREVIEELANRTGGGEASAPAGPWIETLNHESWRVRRTAVEDNSRNSAPEAIAALLQSVRDNHHNFGLLNSALRVLALSNVDTHATLVDFLGSPDADLRMQAALALGTQKDARAIPHLMTALKDENVNVVYHAIEALGVLRALEASDVLTSIAESRDFFLGFPALDALGEIGDSRMAARLVPLLQDETLRDPAAHALAKIGDESTVEPLVKLLNDPEGPAEAAAKALAVLYDRYEQFFGEGQHIADLCRANVTATGIQNLIHAVSNAGSEDLRPLILVLGWLNSAAGIRALTLHLGSPALRDEIIEGLVRHGPAVTEVLLDQVRSEDLEIRRSAITALGRIRDSRAASVLSGLLQPERELAIEIAGALASIGDSSVVEPLFGLLDSRNAAVRRAAVAALNTLALPEMADRVVPLLDDPDPAKREAGVRIAGYFGYTRCIDTIFQRCQDEDIAVRRAAIEHIPYLDDPRGYDVLARALSEDTPEVRAVAAKAVGYLKPAEAVPLLIRALDDNDGWVRYFAVRTLGVLRGSEAGPKLGRLAESDPFEHVRIAALENLLQINEETALPVARAFLGSSNPDMQQAVAANTRELSLLLDALRSVHPTVRSAAATSLGERGKSDAVDALRSTAELDEDPAVTKAAILALRKIPTSEGTATLIDLLNDPARRELASAALANPEKVDAAALRTGLQHPSPAVRLALVGVLERSKWPHSAELLRLALRDATPAVSVAAASALARNRHRPIESARDVHRAVNHEI